MIRKLFDDPQQTIGKSERTILVYVKFANNKYHYDNLEEFKHLALSSGIDVIDTIFVNRNSPCVKFFIGNGKVAQLKEIVATYKIDLLIFSSQLSPSQERNLEKEIQCQVMDKTRLILDIFSLRALSFEGKLQVELAQLRHLSTRLIRGWTHLERQKGGIGLRGPGETQLETDRRLIGQRIKYLNRRLEKVDKQRKLGRKSRIKNDIPVIALAGYTNAGKSTLFNNLTKANTYVDNKLFATLDSTIRRVVLPASGNAVIVDTVGFIQDLPHDLIAAFKSTLEETSKASVLLHIVDSTDENNIDKITQVENIIKEIGADTIPSIIVMNKIDKIDDFEPRVDKDINQTPKKVWVSSKNGKGIDLLYQSLSYLLSGVMINAKIRLKLQSAYIRNEIYNIGFISKENIDEFGQWILEIRVTRHYLNKILNKKGVELLWG